MPRFDPTRLATLRRSFISELRRVYRKLTKDVKDRVYTELSSNPSSSPSAFPTTFILGNASILLDQDRLSRFLVWLGERLGLSTNPYLHRITPLLPESSVNRYVRDAYSKGVVRSHNDIKRDKTTLRFAHTSKLFRVEQSLKERSEEFLREHFSKKATTEKLKVLESRTFSELQGVSQQSLTSLSRLLSDAMMNGTPLQDVASQIASTLSVNLSRATAVAQTELTRAHSEGQLDAMEAMGVSELGVAVEWDTSHDGKVCPLCKPLEGVVLRIEEARGMLPRHPHCRCAFIPAALAISSSRNTIPTSKVGISPELPLKTSSLPNAKKLARKKLPGQKRQKREVERAISKSKNAEKKRRKRGYTPTWGPGKKITKRS